MTNIDLVGQPIGHLLDRDARLETYKKIDNFLALPDGFDKSSVLDMMAYMKNSLPDNLEEVLKETKGMRIDTIGGGISGVMTAYMAGELSRLYNLNWEIHVWDKNSGAGFGSTMESAARIRTSLYSREEVRGSAGASMFYDNLADILARGARESGVEWVHDVHTGIERASYLWLFESRHKWVHGKKVENGVLDGIIENHKVLAELGIPTYVLTPGQVEMLMPDLQINKESFEFAYMGPTDGHIEPTNVVNALERYGKDVLGVKFRYDQSVEEIIINPGERIRFRTKYTDPSAPEEMQEHETDRLSLTTGSFTEWLNGRVKLDGKTVGKLDLSIRPVARQLTHIGGYDENELRQFEPFIVYMTSNEPGNSKQTGVYLSRESRGSSRIIVGCAGDNDPRFDLEKMMAGKDLKFNGTSPNLDYFMGLMIDSTGIMDVFPIILEKMKIIKHTGATYGYTKDGSYLAGPLDQLNAVNPNGLVTIDAGHNGHGIMISPDTALSNVLSMVGLANTPETNHYHPSRDMSMAGTTSI